MLHPVNVAFAAVLASSALAVLIIEALTHNGVVKINLLYSM